MEIKDVLKDVTDYDECMKAVTFTSAEKDGGVSHQGNFIMLFNSSVIPKCRIFCAMHI